MVQTVIYIATLLGKDVLINDDHAQAPHKRSTHTFTAHDTTYTQCTHVAHVSDYPNTIAQTLLI